jgi:hypothetical protein
MDLHDSGRNAWNGWLGHSGAMPQGLRPLGLRRPTLRVGARQPSATPNLPESRKSILGKPDPKWARERFRRVNVNNRGGKDVLAVEVGTSAGTTGAGNPDIFRIRPDTLPAPSAK